MDLDPFVPVGIAADDALPRRLLLTACSPTARRYAGGDRGAGRNQQRTASHGREPGLRWNATAGGPAHDWAAELLQQCCRSPLHSMPCTGSKLRQDRRRRTGGLADPRRCPRRARCRRCSATSAQLHRLHRAQSEQTRNTCCAALEHRQQAALRKWRARRWPSAWPSRRPTRSTSRPSAGLPSAETLEPRARPPSDGGDRRRWPACVAASAPIAAPDGRRAVDPGQDGAGASLQFNPMRRLVLSVCCSSCAAVALGSAGRRCCPDAPACGARRSGAGERVPTGPAEEALDAVRPSTRGQPAMWTACTARGPARPCSSMQRPPRRADRRALRRPLCPTPADPSGLPLRRRGPDAAIRRTGVVACPPGRGSAIRSCGPAIGLPQPFRPFDRSARPTARHRSMTMTAVHEQASPPAPAAAAPFAAGAAGFADRRRRHVLVAGAVGPLLRSRRAAAGQLGRRTAPGLASEHARPR